MAENLTLARPYAEAAFQLAKGSNALAAWSESLGKLAAITTSAEMLESIGNPRMTPSQLTKLCVDVLGDGGNNSSLTIINCIRFIPPIVHIDHVVAKPQKNNAHSNKRWNC